MSLEMVRLAFLGALFAFVLFFWLRFRTPGAGWLGEALLNVLILGSALLTVLTFITLLFRIDLMPIIRHSTYLLSFQQNLSFADAIPPSLTNDLKVVDVRRIDTDGDGFDEWVVFYRFDRRGDAGPVKAVVYDNDRGNPPVIFPYNLLPPGRNYLTEGGASLEMRQIVLNQENPETDPREIVIASGTELSIFTFRQNSEAWDFPRDAPPRYQPIGFFRGNGGVFLNDDHSVTVRDRSGYERSQLVVRSIYSLNETTKTYWDQFYEPTELDRQLRAPTFTTIDFLNGPPDNIQASTYPEVIVLGFYAANCIGNNSSLCSAASAGWNPRGFLARDALREYDNNNSGYFGLTGFKSIQQLAVTNLRYYPSLETDRDLLPTGGGRDVVTGEAGQLNVVDITFVLNSAPADPHRFAMELIDGQWRITQRLPYVDLPELTNPAQLSTSSPN